MCLCRWMMKTPVSLHHVFRPACIHINVLHMATVHTWRQGGQLACTGCSHIHTNCNRGLKWTSGSELTAKKATVVCHVLRKKCFTCQKADLWSHRPTGGWVSPHWALGFPCYRDLRPRPSLPQPPKPACLLTWSSCAWPVSTSEEVPAASHLWRVKPLQRDRGGRGREGDMNERGGKEEREAQDKVSWFIH